MPGHNRVICIRCLADIQAPVAQPCTSAMHAVTSHPAGRSVRLHPVLPVMNNSSHRGLKWRSVAHTPLRGELAARA
ncbi:MAG TPA: hypothetical protein VGI66_12395 [Streptosporangiaceae bacterium]